MTLEERIAYLERQVSYLQTMHATLNAENEAFINRARSFVQARGDRCIQIEQATQRAELLRHELQTLKEDFPQVAEYLAKERL